MSLSNTATPKYYGEFRTKVLRGEIPVCKEIAMTMALIDEKIANPAFYYDEDAINGFVAFCETELTLTDGSDLELLDTFKLWAEDALSWFFFVERSVYVPGKNNHGGHYVKKRIKKRLVTKQFLIVARGAAKSMYLSAMQNYFLNVDGTTTQQITTAPTMDQAEGVMGPIRTSITRSRGPFFKFLTAGSLQNTTGNRALRAKLVSTKKGIENFATNSIILVRPMSVDKLQGYAPKLSTVDEWLSGDIKEDVIGALEQGSNKVDQALIIAASSEGTVRNGPGDSIKMELLKILRGEYYAPHYSIWYYRLDDVSEVSDPSMWIKANPNLDKTISYEDYQKDVEKAERIPSALNDILAKRFGIPREGFSYFFTYEQTIKHSKHSFWKCPCSLGIDLSQGDDFCAFTFLFPLPRMRFGVKARCYITEKTLYGLPIAMRTKYDEFINEGTLIVMPGVILDMMEVYEDLEQFIADSLYDVRCVGYDVYNAEEFIKRWCLENGEYGVEKVRQGSRTETVPLGELRDLADERALIFDEEIVTFCMGNCITLEDTNGNRKLLKTRNEAKIDVVSAMMDAFVSFKLHKDEFE